MTSTFPTSRSSSQSLRNGFREIQRKKETLMTLEIALEKRINEFRELCLKEGELTGHLPVDYPLKPREPIPQVRRRLTRSNGNIPNELLASNSLLQTALRSQSHRLTPSSTSSTISAEESLRTRLQSIDEPPSGSGSIVNGLATQTRSASEMEPSKMANAADDKFSKQFQPYYEETKPFQMSDFYKYSSKLRQHKAPSINNNNNNNSNSNRQHVANRAAISNGDVQLNHPNLDNLSDTQQANKQQAAAPARPPRSNSNATQFKATFKHPAQFDDRLSSHSNTNSNVAMLITDNRPKTTRQLQEDVAGRLNHVRMASYDDRILASHTLIEKSGRKLIEATAKAIASNPGLAERLNSLLPQHNGTTVDSGR